MSHLFDSFRIGHFRGFTDVELTDCGAVNLLIGANNSGKSSILEVLALYAHQFD
jgi:AAA15 family ATPase/GTPase